MQTTNGVTYGNNSILPGGYLISHIHWLNKIRKTSKQADVVTGINISISILLCSYVEAVLFEILSRLVVERKKVTTDSSYQKLLDNTLDKISKASWTQYLELCEVLLPTPLHRYTDNETWKGITILFNLRNLIVHGKAVSSKLLVKGDKLEIEYSGVLEKIMNYFKEQKVLKTNQLKSSNHKILSTQATVHFIKITDKFVDEIFFKIVDEQKIDRMFLSVTYKNSYLLNHHIDPETLKKRKNKIKLGKDDLPF